MGNATDSASVRVDSGATSEGSSTRNVQTPATNMKGVQSLCLGAGVATITRSAGGSPGEALPNSPKWSQVVKQGRRRRNNVYQ